MTASAVHGYPRIGRGRELKHATERYWAGTASKEELLATGSELRLAAWRRMREAGIDLIPSNTFSLYDHVLDTAALVGAVPPRYRWDGDEVDLDTYFAMARGAQGGQLDVTAMEMTKWFDTNYHFIVPELGPQTRFRLASQKPLGEYREARAAGIETVPVLLGPLSFLLLSKSPEDPGFDRLSLLPALGEVYADLLRQLAAAGARWVQLDEPVLVQDRDPRELGALTAVYETLARASGDARLLVQTYFGDVDEAFHTLLTLPVAAIGLDLRRGRRNAELVRRHGLAGKHLVAGVVDGRNIWRTDLADTLAELNRLRSVVGEDRLIVGSSCSLLHVPIDAEREDRLDGELGPWLAFADQKIEEIATLARALGDPADDAVAERLAASERVAASRRGSRRAREPAVRERLAATTDAAYRRRSPATERRAVQERRFGLPLLPTTTIGSFPQTPELRRARRQRDTGEIDEPAYESVIESTIERVIRLQEEIGLDVLVHGEPERGDMVEHFGRELDGFAFTRFGWVQSYGSRYVKPPIIYGDVSRPADMTVRWSRYAQSLTERPVKGMLTGPVTILNWSFVRDDQPRADTCRQIALAIRDETIALEAAGISVIQIDEPALREGLPLRRRDWTAYLAWAVACFRLATAGVADETQIHTHMCYAEFNDVIEAISDLDADVISIENARSGAELLRVFKEHSYEKGIGPGVYDIHSPRVPPADEMAQRLREAVAALPAALVWVNPDCGLKTRRYEETEPSLRHMVEAARGVRADLGAPRAASALPRRRRAT